MSDDEHMIATCIWGYHVHVYSACPPTYTFAAAMAIDGTSKDRCPEQSIVCWGKLAFHTSKSTTLSHPSTNMSG